MKEKHFRNFGEVRFIDRIGNIKVIEPAQSLRINKNTGEVLVDKEGMSIVSKEGVQYAA